MSSFGDELFCELVLFSFRSRTFSGSGGEDWDLATSTAYVTASWSGSDNQGGGNWYTGSLDTNANIEVSQCFTLRSEKDLNAPERPASLLNILKCFDRWSILIDMI